MLIKEYRICMPLSVEEYRIAQLYMIQKKSRDESHGSGSGVEILINEPYMNGPGGNGQYTKKIYHIGSHLPGWFRSILPKSALIVEEDAWNAYPYTKTIYKCPFIDKFVLDIETVYHNDAGTQDNVFKLNDAELHNRIVDFMDIVNDSISGGDYSDKEDPKLYVSIKTGRGPLTSSWREDTASGTGQIMCAYKLCKVEFRYWGMQTKIERFIHDVALRKTMLRAHRQAWCWQDEYYGLTMEDIRKLEDETKRKLEEKMRDAEKLEQLEPPNDKANNSNYEIADNLGPAEIVGMANRGSINRLSFTSCASQSKELSLLENLVSECSEDEFFDADEDLDNTNSISSSSGQMSDLSSVRQLSNTSTSSHLLVLLLRTESVNDDLLECADDLKTLRCTFENVIHVLCPRMLQRIHFRSVTCRDYFEKARNLLLSMNVGWETIPPPPSQIRVDLLKRFPFGTLPFFVAGFPDFLEISQEMTANLNRVYAEFLSEQEEGIFFGQIILITDSISSLPLYSILTNKSKNLKQNFPQNFASINELKNGPFQAGNSPRHLLNPDLRGSPSRSIKSTDMGFKSTNIGSKSSQVINKIVPIENERTERIASKQDEELHFEVKDVFMLGSSIGTIIAYKQSLAQESWALKPACGQIYNLFYGCDPLASRVEPLFDERFIRIPPITLPRYNSHPLGDGVPIFLEDTLRNSEEMFSESYVNEDTVSSMKSLNSICNHNNVIIDNWWGSKRLDYLLYSPPGLNEIPETCLPHILSASFWQNEDLVAFVLRQIVRSDFITLASCGSTEESRICGSTKNKWRRKRTALKVRKVSANHRGNDIIILVGRTQVLNARFTYGPLDIVSLTKEKVDIFIQEGPYWKKWEEVLTDSHGRISYTIPPQFKLSEGRHKIKMQVQGDGTSLILKVAVIPLRTKLVIFSVDGSLTASISLTANDPKIKTGVEDVVRYWSNLGYLILYISSRPDMQHRGISLWLARHSFEEGMCVFVDGISTEPLKQKAAYLKQLITNMGLIVCRAYGSNKDIAVYQSVGIPDKHICVCGKVSRKYKNIPNDNLIGEGYTKHLEKLRSTTNHTFDYR